MKKLIVMMLSSVALLSTSCSKDSQDIESASPIHSAQAEAPKVVGSLALNLSGSTEHARALSYDGLDRDGKTILSDIDQDWSTTLFIRNEAGTVQFTAEMTWTASTRQGDKLNLTSTKNRNGHTFLTLTGGNGAALPAKGETWYIAGILGGGTVAPDGTSVRFDNSEALTTSSNKANIPYVFGWTPFVVGDEDAPAKATVHFKPQGVQLVVKADQARGKVHPIYLPKTHIITNVLTQNGYFDFAPGAKPVEGVLPTFVQGSEVSATSEERLVAQMGFQGDLLSAMVWGMPKDVLPADPKTRPCVVGYIANKRGERVEHGLRRGDFKSGSTYEIKLSIHRPRMPLELLAEYNMAEDRVSFAKTHNVNGDDPASLDEYIPRAYAVANYNPINIDGKWWRLPKREDMAGAYMTGFWKFWNPQNYMDPRLYEAPYMFGVPLTTERESFKAVAWNLGYALRLGDANRGNVFLTAYRYEFLGQPTDQARMVIRARYIGGSSGGLTLDDIAQEGYWNTPSEEGIVERIIPLQGYIILPKSLQAPGLLFDLGLDDSFAQGYGLSTNSWMRYHYLTSSNQDNYGMTVRLTRMYCCELDDEQHKHS